MCLQFHVNKYSTPLTAASRRADSKEVVPLPATQLKSALSLPFFIICRRIEKDAVSFRPSIPVELREALGT